jgi:CCR4-NOT transcription complex subunit 1
MLYRAETPLARELYATLLERLCNLSVKVGKEVTAWLVYAEDEVRDAKYLTRKKKVANLCSIAQVQCSSHRHARQTPAH